MEEGVLFQDHPTITETMDEPVIPAAVADDQDGDISLVTPSISFTEVEIGNASSTASGKKRGRPRKYPPKEVDPDAPRRPRGRPRSNLGLLKDPSDFVRKRGRPRKSEGGNHTSEMNGGDNEDDEHEQIKRPRSKSQPIKLSLQSLDDQAEHTNTQQKKMSAIQNSLGRMRNLKKKVGRPKKQAILRPSHSDQESDDGSRSGDVSDAVISDSDSASPNDVEVTVNGRKRGRPRKSDLPISPKKRGRPPKTPQRTIILSDMLIHSSLDGAGDPGADLIDPAADLAADLADDLADPVNPVVVMTNSSRPPPTECNPSTTLIRKKRKYTFINRKPKASKITSSYDKGIRKYAFKNRQHLLTRSSPSTAKSNQQSSKRYNGAQNQPENSLPTSQLEINNAMLDVIHTQQKMLHDQDVLFALSLVDKFRELDQDQRSLAQTEIIQILQRAKRHAGIPDAHAAYRMIVCRLESESPTDTETNNGIDEDLAIIKASLMARRRPGARVITPSRHMSVSLVPKLVLDKRDGSVRPLNKRGRKAKKATVKAVPLRGRGRPAKKTTVTSAPLRGRGRPSSNSLPQQSSVLKRGRGRPKSVSGSYVKVYKKVGGRQSSKKTTASSPSRSKRRSAKVNYGQASSDDEEIDDPGEGTSSGRRGTPPKKYKDNDSDSSEDDRTDQDPDWDSEDEEENEVYSVVRKRRPGQRVIKPSSRFIVSTGFISRAKHNQQGISIKGKKPVKVQRGRGRPSGKSKAAAKLAAKYKYRSKRGRPSKKMNYAEPDDEEKRRYLSLKSYDLESEMITAKYERRPGARTIKPAQRLIVPRILKKQKRKPYKKRPATIIKKFIEEHGEDWKLDVSVQCVCLFKYPQVEAEIAAAQVARDGSEEGDDGSKEGDDVETEAGGDGETMPANQEEASEPEGNQDEPEHADQEEDGEEELENGYEKEEEEETTVQCEAGDEADVASESAPHEDID